MNILSSIYALAKKAFFHRKHHSQCNLHIFFTSSVIFSVASFVIFGVIFLSILCLWDVEFYVVTPEKKPILPDTITVMYTSPNTGMTYEDIIYYARC